MSKISIITVVYNDVLHIKKTIKSVLNQTYSNIEYLIIDGGSTDGTLEIIKDYVSELSFFASEKDNGIYDAMNKGIKNATGEWLLFLNSGDVIYDSNTITNLNKLFESCNADIVYGNISVISHELKVNFDIPARDISGLPDGMVMNHQACFIKRMLHLENLYDLRFRIAADYYFFLKLFLENRRFLRVPLTISTISTGGLSDSNRIKTFKESLRVKNELKPGFGNYIYFFKQVFYAALIKLIKLLVSKNAFVRLYKRKYKLV